MFVTPRNRLITFRVTDEELRHLKTASAMRNARCLSEFARTAMLETARSCAAAFDTPDTVSGQLQSFDRRLARLETSVARLIAAITDDRPLHTESSR